MKTIFKTSDKKFKFTATREVAHLQPSCAYVAYDVCIMEGDFKHINFILYFYPFVRNTCCYTLPIQIYQNKFREAVAYFIVNFSQFDDLAEHAKQILKM